MKKLIFTRIDKRFEKWKSIKNSLFSKGRLLSGEIGFALRWVLIAKIDRKLPKEDLEGFKSPNNLFTFIQLAGKD